jgi:hypothetical protein
MVEIKGDEIVVQFADGPVLYAQHACLAQLPNNGAPAICIAGPVAGRVELDNLTIWSIRAEAEPSWSQRRAEIPIYTPVQISVPKVKKGDAK